LRDGLGPASPGRVRPANRQQQPLADLGRLLRAKGRETGLTEQLVEWLHRWEGAPEGIKPPPPFRDTDLDKLLQVILDYCGLGWQHGDVEEGQTFRLDLIEHLGWLAGDPDWVLVDQIRGGAPMLVDEPAVVPVGAMIEKGEDSDGYDSDEMDELHAEKNYGSAKVNEAILLADLVDDVKEGFAFEARDWEHAARICNCTKSEIILSPTGARTEADKTRRIQSGKDWAVHYGATSWN
jgi:hypothetical protein